MAFAEIGIEQAELFPKFFITGDIGSASLLFGDLFSSAGRIWSFGSMIQWSIFQSGALNARIDAARANSQSKVLEYEKTVLEALTDVETALTRYGQELETRKLLEMGVQSRRKSVKLAQKLFNAGEEDYLAVLDTERELTNSEDDLVVSETKTITNLIALYTALGGGWQTLNSPDLN
jgi:multidrug efflux system outer membrane protein